MIRTAVTLLIIGIIAAALGLGGLGGLIMNVGYVLLAVGVVLVLVHFITRKV